MSGYLELEDKRALVTGGTKGVGASVVAALREAGARVLTTARKPPEGVSEAEFVAADVSTAEGCAAVADAVRKRLGGLYVEAGDFDEAAKSYARALKLVTNDSERRYLERRLREVQSPVAVQSATQSAMR